MTFTVTDIPNQVTMTGWGVVSVYNDGPSTVYLGEDSSLNASNGVALPPKANTTWQDTFALWLCTAKGERASTLILNRAGTAIADSRTELDVPLLTNLSARDGGFFVPKIDVSSYTQLSLSWYENSNSSSIGIVVIECRWNDVYRTRLTVNSLYGENVVFIPVEGSDVTLSVYYSVAIAGANPNWNSIQVSGTTRARPNSVYQLGSARRSDGLEPFEVDTKRRSVLISSYGPSRTYLIPNMGGSLTMSLTGTGGLTAGAGAAIAIVDSDFFSNAQGVYAKLDLATVSAGRFFFTSTSRIPTDRPLSIQSMINTFSSTQPMTLSLVWSD